MRLGLCLEKEGAEKDKHNEASVDPAPTPNLSLEVSRFLAQREELVIIINKNKEFLMSGIKNQNKINKIKQVIANSDKRLAIIDSKLAEQGIDVEDISDKGEEAQPLAKTMMSKAEKANMMLKGKERLEAQYKALRTTMRGEEQRGQRDTPSYLKHQADLRQCSEKTNKIKNDLMALGESSQVVSDGISTGNEVDMSDARDGLVLLRLKLLRQLRWRRHYTPS